MRAKDAVGRYGEDVAVRHLTDAGFTVLARNWRCPAGEIDVIARDGAALVFCEVKTRSSTAYGSPVDALTPRKVAKLRELALLWLRENPSGGAELRFDVVGVLRSTSGAATVRHLRGAF